MDRRRDEQLVLGAVRMVLAWRLPELARSLARIEAVSRRTTPNQAQLAQQDIAVSMAARAIPTTMP